jgi:hypothetical protein
MAVWALAPCRAAPVRMRPRIGPAQGAQSNPVPMPSRKEFRTLLFASEFLERRLPSWTMGREIRSASEEKSKVRPKMAKSTSAAIRPNWLARTAQPPPTVARLATRAKVIDIPASSGKPLLRKGWSERAKTNGSTGRMHGLKIVRTPPRYAKSNRNICLPCSFRLPREDRPGSNEITECPKKLRPGGTFGFTLKFLSGET